MKDMEENGGRLPAITDTSLTHRVTGSLAGVLITPEEIEAARQFADASRASSTRRAYASDWRLFVAWCTDRGVVPLPADPVLVAVYLSAEASRGAKPSTISRRLSAIGYYHHRAQLPAPTAMAGAVAIKLCNSDAAWSPRQKADAIYDIENGVHEYWVPWANSPETKIRVVNGTTGKYLRTDRDTTSRNNLDDLPDC
jgi:hypothetical protein